MAAKNKDVRMVPPSNDLSAKIITIPTIADTVFVTNSYGNCPIRCIEHQMENKHFTALLCVRGHAL